MPRGVTTAGVGFDVDMELVIARMKNMDASLRDLTQVYREAATPIFAGYKAIAPYGGSGGFKRAIYKEASYTHGAVGLKGTGRARGGPTPYAGVVEFGGTIPVPHSAPKGQPRRMANRDKPWIGGAFGSSYYLYPLWDAKWRLIVPPFVNKLREVCARYLPSRGTL